MTSERLIAALVEDLRPVRRLPAAGRRALAWVTLALGCVALGLLALGHRADLAAKLREPRYLAEGAALLALVAVAARSAFRLGVPGAERVATAWVVPTLGLVAWVAILAGEPAGAGMAQAPGHGLRCAAKLAALSLAPAALMLVMLRRSLPLAAGWTGWFALLAAGALGVLGTRLICVRDATPHVLVWHLGPLVVAALLGGAVVSRLLLRWRASGG
jgi:hypothetical protein